MRTGRRKEKDDEKVELNPGELRCSASTRENAGADLHAKRVWPEVSTHCPHSAGVQTPKSCLCGVRESRQGLLPL